MVILQLAFETHGVEIQIADVIQLGFLPFGRRAHQEVHTVARAADEYLLAIDVEQPMPLAINLRSHLPYAEANVTGIRDSSANFELQVKWIEVLRPKWAGHQRRGFANLSCGNLSGVKWTTCVWPGPGAPVAKTRCSRSSLSGSLRQPGHCRSSTPP